MPILVEAIEFVKRELAYHQRQASKAPGQPTVHHKLAREFEALFALLGSPELAAAMTRAQAKTAGDDALAFIADNPTQVHPALLEGLPSELVEQLQISDTDRFQWQVVDIINRAPDRIVSIEVLLIALFKMTGRVYERLDLSNRMYRMARKGMAFSVPGRKGWYTTVPTDEPTLDFDSPQDQEGQS